MARPSRPTVVTDSTGHWISVSLLSPWRPTLASMSDRSMWQKASRQRQHSVARRMELRANGGQPSGRTGSGTRSIGLCAKSLKRSSSARVNRRKWLGRDSARGSHPLPIASIHARRSMSSPSRQARPQARLRRSGPRSRRVNGRRATPVRHSGPSGPHESTQSRRPLQRPS